MQYRLAVIYERLSSLSAVSLLHLAYFTLNVKVDNMNKKKVSIYAIRCAALMKEI